MPGGRYVMPKIIIPKIAVVMDLKRKEEYCYIMAMRENMNKISKEQHDRACAVRLDDWLLKNHPNDVHKKYNSVLLDADTHVAVGPDFHGYKNFQTGESGNNIDFLCTYLGYDYRTAVLALICEQAGEDEWPWNVPQIVSSGEIDIPVQAHQYKNAYAYLANVRKIPNDTIHNLVDRGVLYQESEHNNMVFVTPERDYCEIRGTNDIADRRCKHSASCSEYSSGSNGWCSQMGECRRYKKNPFHGCKKKCPDRYWYYYSESSEQPETAYICESAIDAVSLYLIYKHKGIDEPAAFISIGGVANQRAIDRAATEYKNVVIATDNDDAGNECRKRNNKLKTIVPVNKDWNDDWQKGAYMNTDYFLLETGNNAAEEKENVMVNNDNEYIATDTRLAEQDAGWQDFGNTVLYEQQYAPEPDVPDIPDIGAWNRDEFTPPEISNTSDGEMPAKLTHIMQIMNNLAPMSSLKDKYISACKEKQKIISTGFAFLDSALVGGLPPVFTLIAAKPGEGKSAFTFAMARKMAQNGTKVLFISLEMSVNEYVSREVASMSFEHDGKNGIRINDMVYGISDENKANKEFMDKFSRYTDEFFQKCGDNLFIYADGSGELTATDIANMAYLFKMRTCSDGSDCVVFIDYLQRIITDDKSNIDRKDILDSTCRTLKKLVVTCNMPVVAISSVSRAYYDNVGMGSCKESGDIEYTAELFFSIYRADAKNKNKGKGAKDSQSDKTNSSKEYENMGIDIIKNRNGRSGITVDFRHYPDFNYFCGKTAESVNKSAECTDDTNGTKSIDELLNSVLEKDD